jgi:hypothetical protein
MTNTHSTPIQDTLDRLDLLDSQWSKGHITAYDLEAQRLVALVDLVSVVTAKDPYAFNQPW